MYVEVRMTRKVSSILLLLAQLTVFAGCRQTAHYELPPEGPPPLDIRSGTNAPPLSTATSREDDPRPNGKLPAGPPLPVLEVSKKPGPGTTGIVTLEGEPSPPTNILVFPPAAQDAKKADLEPVAQALDWMLKGRHAEAIKCLSIYDDDKQEVLLRLLPICTQLVNKRIADLTTQEVGFVHKQLDGLRDSLLPRSELLITRMCFCKDVRGFGSYEKLPDSHQFLTGAQDRIGELVQLYIELKNFASEPTKDGQFVTKLSCSLELHDAAGKKIWSKPFEGNETTLRRSARLHDFYSRYAFYVPAIPAGTYKLTLRVADETNPQSRRIAERSLVFQATPVANQPSLR